MPKVNEEYLRERRGHILNSAKSCFAKNGFHKTTMREIQKKSSLSAGAVYRYFKSKEDIIEAIARQDLDDRIGIIDRIAHAGDRAGRFRKLAEDFFSVLANKEKPFISLELELWAEARRNSKIMEIQRKSQETIAEQFAKMIEEGQKNGEVRKEFDPLSTARIMISMRRGLMAQLAVNKNIDIDKYQENVVRMFFGGMLILQEEKR